MARNSAGKSDHLTAVRQWDSLIIGDPLGMGSVVERLLRVSRKTIHREQFPDEPVHPEPDLVLVCQQWPEEYTLAQVEWLIDSFPLARIICCYGPWCESDGRTRALWPASLRVPIRDAAARIDREVAVLSGILDPLPVTASLDEVFAFDQKELSELC